YQVHSLGLFFRKRVRFDAGGKVGVVARKAADRSDHVVRENGKRCVVALQSFIVLAARDPYTIVAASEFFLQEHQVLVIAQSGVLVGGEKQARGLARQAIVCADFFLDGAGLIEYASSVSNRSLYLGLELGGDVDSGLECR